MVKRVLFLAATTGYQTRMFGEAAERLGVELVFATDRCDHLADPWRDAAIPIRFHQEADSIASILGALGDRAVDGVLAVADRPTVIAARVAQALGLPGHPPGAAAAARDKRLMRERLRTDGMPVPWHTTTDLQTSPESLRELPFPVVVKPAALSGSRGVMRADTPDQFIRAHERLCRLLQSVEVRALQDDALDTIVIESYIDGAEYAVEGVLEGGRLQLLAIFDKPDPLEGPFFEETIYVTPSRAPADDQASIRRAIEQAVRAIGLHHGPIHAECRVNAAGVFVLEVAARPIGGLCARALRFSDGTAGIGLEELLLRHATGESVARWRPQADASGVMMIPIPSAGTYRRVDGVEDATRVEGIEDVRITAKPDQRLVPLPEGASYLGFIFARAEAPDRVERALREAHARLEFTIDRPLPIL
jgi:biotin carboxylase